MRWRIKSSLMRIADRSRALARPPRPHPEAKEAFRRASSLLVLDVCGLGDTICLEPFLRRLFQARTGAAIDFLGASFAPGLLGKLPFRSIEPVSGSLFKAARRVHSGRYDLVLLPGWVFKNTLILYLSGRTPAAGYLMDRSFRGRLHADLEVEGHGVTISGNFPLPRETHLTRRGDPLLAALGLEPAALELGSAMLESPLPDEVAGAAGESGYAVFHLGAGWDLRRWGIDGFGEISRRWIENAGSAVCLVGSEADRKLSIRLTRRLGRVAERGIVDLTGRLSLPQLATLLRGAEVFLGNDSGPMHMANALGCRIVALMGPNLPEISGPWRARGRILHHRMACCPCDQISCPEERPCMTRVDIDQVWEAVWEGGTFSAPQP